MTPARQPQHCDHECVCMGMPNFYEVDESCTKDKCKHDTRTTHSSQPVPDSTTLMQMAETEWHNREERFGLHDAISWTTGWMAGYLTTNKPDWSKEHDTTIRKSERERVLDEVIHDVERMIDAEQERTVDGEYTKDGITKLGILAYVSEHFKSLRGGEQE